MKDSDPFRFKQFEVHHRRCAMKVGTDAVLLGAWVDLSDAKRLLDVGTGCGIIALILAQRSSDETRIDAIDLAAQEVEQARSNFELSPFANKLHAIPCALQTFRPGIRYDHIVSNPPYFINSIPPPSPDRTRARHAHMLTLDELFTSASKLLNPKGYLSLILPADQFDACLSHAGSNLMYLNRRLQVRSRVQKPIERELLTFGFMDTGPPSVEALTIHEGAEEYSERYKDLVREFYLKF